MSQTNSQSSPPRLGPIATFWSRYSHILQPAASLVFFAVAMWLLHHEFKTIHAKDIADSFRSLPWWTVLVAIALTAANYVVLIGYDWLGVRLVNHPLTAKQIAITSFISYAFSNSLGVVLGGTPVRARLYSLWGMTSPEIVRLVFFIGFAFWIGLFSLGGLLFAFTPFDIPAKFNLPISTSRPLGLILLTLSGAFFAACAIRRKPLHLFGVNFQPPPLRIALAQAIVSAADFVLAAAVLYVLLPNDIPIGFLPFVAIFLLAIIVALASHVPGGLGVLELVLITTLPKSDHSLVASLLAFRVIYYLLPLLVAIIGIAIATVRQHSGTAKEFTSLAAKWTSVISPRVITGSVFVAGMILLVSGALPVGEGRMQLLRRALPLPLIEVSHFIGSIIGALLLVLARGLQRRIDVAWTATVAMLALGVIVSLLKGFDYEEAIILTVLLVALLPSRKAFYRHGALLSPSFSFTWMAAFTMSLGLLVWIVLFAYRHVEFTGDMWWSFAYHGDAPRSLRGLVGAAVVMSLMSIARLLKSTPTIGALPDEGVLADVAAVVQTADATNANLALLGDKRFIFSDDRNAFVMFGCEGKSWIAMGDPVGQRESTDDAAWNFREACDAAGVHCVFYQVDEFSLGRYVEMGLTMLKLGEEARVSLGSFSLEGSSRKDLRRTKKKSGEAGLRFELVPQANVAKLMPQLKAISDAWLSDKSAGEKGFSLGYFDETYLNRYDMAMIYQGDKPIAFANVWKGANKHELSIDLMRFLPDAPHGVMEYLFIELMLYGHAAGYEYFNLGMAPLSGVESHRLGPLWNRVSDLMFRHGEHFYNFQGLRSYKEKFDPEWTPKYLASPGGFATPQILANVSTLISGGLGKLLHN